MRFGVHISIASGIENAPQRAKNVGAETFQIFSRPPRGGKPKITNNQAKFFRAQCKEYNFSSHYIHAPYYINLASKNNKIYFGSIGAIAEELEIADLLGTNFVITHIGSARDMTETEAISRVVKAVEKISQKISLEKLLFELSAGQGAIIGNTFEELAKIIEETQKNQLKIGGICLDTCHLLASGYEIRTKEGIKKTLDDFDKILGINLLKVIHLNDSVFDLGSHKDRHEHIGKGKIDIEGFKAILSEPRLKNFDFILETPKESDQDDIYNLTILKDIRSQIMD